MVEAVKDVFDYFRSIIRKMHRIADRELAPYGIGHIEMRAMIMIYKCQTGCTQEELSSRFDMDRSNVGRALKRLETLDFIKREKDESDGRMYRIYLKEKGFEIKDTLMEVQKNVRTIFLSGITEHEFSDLIKILGKVDESITDHHYFEIKKMKE